MGSKTHPNLKETFFEVINDKDKAYCFGLLCADGCVSIDKRASHSMRVILTLKKSDEETLNVFIHKIGANIEKKRYYDGSAEIRINSNKIVADLIKYGCIPRKSRTFELPILESRELYLAFLLGYFDGDGKQNSTILYSGSKKFLQQIKELFNISFEIKIQSSKGHSIANRDGGKRFITGIEYTLTLGARLYNEMLENYVDSMPRKRRYFCTPEEKKERQRLADSRNTGKLKLISRQELSKLVWEMPLVHIAKRYGVSGRLISRKCDQLEIVRPPRGYWAIKQIV